MVTTYTKQLSAPPPRHPPADAQAYAHTPTLYSRTHVMYTSGGTCRPVSAGGVRTCDRGGGGRRQPRAVEGRWRGQNG